MTQTLTPDLLAAARAARASGDRAAGLAAHLLTVHDCTPSGAMLAAATEWAWQAKADQLEQSALLAPGGVR